MLLTIGRDLATDAPGAIRGAAAEGSAPITRNRELEQARIVRADPRQCHRRTIAIGEGGAADEVPAESVNTSSPNTGAGAMS